MAVTITVQDHRECKTRQCTRSTLYRVGAERMVALLSVAGHARQRQATIMLSASRPAHTYPWAHWANNHSEN